MRALLMTDGDFGWREQALIRRLQFGLMDEGVRTALATPRAREAGASEFWRSVEVERDDDEDSGPSTELIERIFYTPALTRGGAAREASLLRDRLDRAPGNLIDASTGRADRFVIHALGERCWSVAMRLAIDIGAGALFEVWREAQVRQARRFERLFERQASRRRPDPPRATLRWSAADELLAEELRTSTDAPVETIVWGAHAASGAPSELHAPPGCAALVTSGEDPASVAAAIEGFTAAAAKREDALLFVDEAATRKDRSAWRASAEARILDRVSILPDAEAHRELTLRCPALLMPDRLGERRSIALDAMASGVIVIAATESRSVWLRDGETALLAPGTNAQAWSAALERLWSDADLSERIRAGALQHIRESRRASAHVADAIRAYESAINAASATG